MSRVYAARRHRVPFQVPKRSPDVPMELANVELFLGGIMEDIGSILDEWREGPLNGRKPHPIGISFDDVEMMQPNWIHETLSMSLKTFYIFVPEVQLIYHEVSGG